MTNGIRIIALFVFSLAQWSLAGGGGMDSGGGKFSSTSINPWFLENTSLVKYCIQIDEQNFGIGKVRASQVVAEALAYWKAQLAVADQSNSIIGCIPERSCSPAIGTQEFVEEACSPNVNLKFKLGVLDDENREAIENPKQLVGLAYRMSYDNENLKGNGFIYISPQAGPLKMESEKVLEAPWSIDNSVRLYAVLIHELGHIFGFSHGGAQRIMDEGFAEEVVHSANLGWGDKWLRELLSSRRKLFRYIQSEYIPSGDSSHTVGYGRWGGFEDFWGINSKVQKGDVVSYRFQPGGIFELITYRPQFDPSSQPTVLGTAVMTAGGSDFHRSRLGLFNLFLPKEQKVYRIQSYSNPYTIGVVPQAVQLKGTYSSLDQTIRREITFIARFPLGGGNVGGIHQDKFYFDVFAGF